MARRTSEEEELDDMVECSICTEVFTDPRILPCIHTFCLNCLLSYGKNRRPGDCIPCPLCRKEFTIPADGLSGIQKNFFMEKFLNARKLSGGEEERYTVCDVCSSVEAASAVEPATMHCFECQQNYCEQCSWSHSRMKATADHLQVSVDLGKQIKNDIDDVGELLKKIGEVLPRFQEKKDEIISQFSAIEDEIKTTADNLIAAIQRDKVKLLAEVDTIKVQRLRRLTTVKRVVKQHVTALGSFKRDSETLLSSGTACDVTRSAESLHDRADELMKFDVIGHVDNSLPPAPVNFTPSTQLHVDMENLIGSIGTFNLDYSYQFDTGISKSSSRNTEYHFV